MLNQSLADNHLAEAGMANDAKVEFPADDPLPDRRLRRVLRLVVTVNECNAEYNQFSLPTADRYETTICTFLPTKIAIADHVRIVDGDGTIKSFLRNLQQTLAESDFDVIHAHSPHLATFFLLKNFFRRKRMAKSFYTAHNSFPNFKFRNKLLLIPPFLFFRCVVCCGTNAKESFPWLYRLLAGRRLRAVTNGVNLARVKRCISQEAALDRDVDEGLFNVVCVGRLIPIKCPLAVLEAFHRATGDNARLTYLGDGPLRSDVEAAIERLSPNLQVDMPGIVPREDLFRRAYHSDLFVSASSGEGLPIAVLEAMACGCPVVLSDIPPHREIVEEADFIPLVPVGDVSGFSREIERFQAMSPEERAAIGKQCQQLVEQRFSVDAMHDGYDHLYSEFIPGSST